MEMENLVKSLCSQIDKLNEEVKALKRENKRLREENEDDDEIQVIESTPPAPASKKIKREVDQHWIVSRYVRMVLGVKDRLSNHQFQEIGRVTAMLFRAYYRCGDNFANLGRCNAPLKKALLPKVIGPSNRLTQQYEDSDCHLIEKAYKIVVDYNKTFDQVYKIFMLRADWHRIDALLKGPVTPALLGWK